MSRKKEIKITKSYHYDIKSKNFDAVLSEDFYKSSPEFPFVMTVNRTKTKERLFSKWFKSEDDALNYFANYVAFAELKKNKSEITH